MTYSQFKRWLAAQGVTFAEASRHTKLYYKDKRSLLARHGSREMSEGTRLAILKQLGLR